MSHVMQDLFIIFHPSILYASQVLHKFNVAYLCWQEAERILERIDQLHLEFAKRAAVSLLNNFIQYVSLCNGYFMIGKSMNC